MGSDISEECASFVFVVIELVLVNAKLLELTHYPTRVRTQGTTI